MELLARRLRERGRKLELSDAEVARRSGLSERRYGHYVTGAREPGLETLLRICATLATTPNELLGVGENAVSAVDGEGNGERDEREILMIRLAAAADLLPIDDARLAVKQIETLLHHRRQQNES